MGFEPPLHSLSHNGLLQVGFSTLLCELNDGPWAALVFIFELQQQHETSKQHDYGPGTTIIMIFSEQHQPGNIRYDLNLPQLCNIT